MGVLAFFSLAFAVTTNSQIGSFSKYPPSPGMARLGTRQQARRRIKTEEQATVVGVVWGTELNAVLTANHLAGRMF